MSSSVYWWRGTASATQSRFQEMITNYHGSLAAIRKKKKQKKKKKKKKKKNRKPKKK